jgi:DNA (cytosine-5)-methyltransferase 1
MKRIVAIDLFCGAGGLTRGLLDAGVEVASGYDVDKACRYPYEHNNPPAVFKKRSVASLTGKHLAAQYPPNCWRVLVGCAPCQPFSKYTQGDVAKNHDKWGMLYEFGRIVRGLMPDVVSMENVPELKRHEVYTDFHDKLVDLGYHVSAQKIYCPNYGIPQQRTRLVLFASLHGKITIIPKTHEKVKYLTVRSAIGGLPPLAAGRVCATDPLHRTSSLSETNLSRIRHSKPGGSWRDWPKELVAVCHRRKSGKTYRGVYGRMAWNKPSPTVTTQFFGFGNGRFGHPEQDRAISLREGALLQSFPRTYAFSKPNSDYHFKTIGRLIGNAVPVRLGAVIGKTVTIHLINHEK